MKKIALTLLATSFLWDLASHVVGPGFGPGVSREEGPYPSTPGTRYENRDKRDLDGEREYDRLIRFRGKGDDLFNNFYEREREKTNFK